MTHSRRLLSRSVNAGRMSRRGFARETSMMAGSRSALSTTERESFFAAQARYRSSARRWSLAMALAVFAVTLVISLLLAPAALALFGLLADVVNLVVPVPDVLGAL